jgi:hypothetical protein
MKTACSLIALLILCGVSRVWGQYEPYSLTTLGAISSQSGTLSQTLTVGYALAAGSNPQEPQVVLYYTGPTGTSAFSRYAPDTIPLQLSDIGVMGTYRLQSVVIEDADGQTTYNRDGSISRMSYSATGLPAAHSFNFASDDFVIGPSVRLVNLSTRAQVGTGGNILIPGFVVSGLGMETLLIRADGPALSQFSVAGVLALPSLSVFDQAGNVIATNTGWGTNSDPALVATTAAAVGAFALPSNSADCALIVSLPPGAYTAQVTGVNNTTGVALAEIYEVSSTGTRLVNISTRAQVGTGADIIIPGFVMTGTGFEQLLVRGDGPSLTQFGVPGVLAEPSITLFDGSGSAVASNTAWGTNSNTGQIISDASLVGAFALAPGSADSALVYTFSPGAYTLQVSGAGNSTGDALAEVYEVP